MAGNIPKPDVAALLLAGLPDLFDLAAGADLWRVHSEPDPTVLKVYPSGRFRFDCCDGTWGQTYASAEDLGPFGEVFGDTRRITVQQQQQLTLSCMRNLRDLRLVDLRTASAQSAFGLDLTICTERPYDVTQLWAAAFRDLYGPGVDGIAFLGRKSHPIVAYCLFLDRCGDDLDVQSAEVLEANQTLLYTAASQYQLVVE